MENNTRLRNKSTFSAHIHLTVLPDVFDKLGKDDQRPKEAIVWDCSHFKSWIEDIFLIVVETCIQNWICFLGFLLPVVNQSGGVRDQFGLSRHCSHLWLWLEPSKWPAGPSQSSQNWSEEAGNPGFQFRWSTDSFYSWRKTIWVLSLLRSTFIDWLPKEQWRRTSLRGPRRRWC